MNKLLIVMCISILLTACGTATQVQPVLAQPEQIEYSNYATPATPSNLESSVLGVEEAGDKPAEPEQTIETIFVPDGDLTIEEIIDAYFEQQYLAYSELVHIDISSILDMTNSANRNLLRWSQMLIQRRRLLQENDLCYVETERFPYTIEYDETPEDDRMELWEQWLADTGNNVIHFRIKGESSKAYPPIMAVNSQHSMFFKEIDGEIKITLHYFPGSIRKFTHAGTVRVPNESTMLAQLQKEFADMDFEEQEELPANSVAYDAEEAVDYAMEYTETPNPEFYNIGDWIGNCANFVSQCVSAGFGGQAAMSLQWYGGDGGTPAWENVNYFWTYITSGAEIKGQKLDSASQLQNGDIIQMRTATLVEEKDRFTHMLLVVDDDALMLAQNSPGCFVYYSDLVNAETRYIRPTGKDK